MKTTELIGEAIGLIFFVVVPLIAAGPLWAAVICAPYVLIVLFSHFVWPRDRGFRVTGRY